MFGIVIVVVCNDGRRSLSWTGVERGRAGGAGKMQLHRHANQFLDDVLQKPWKEERECVCVCVCVCV
jgi:hypothetical protein